MASAKLQYDALSLFTITAAALANAAARQSSAVQWDSLQLLDAAVYIEVTLASGAPAGDKKVNVYLFFSMDGTNYTEGAGASDAAVTMTTPTNFILLGSIETPTDKAGAAAWKKWFPSIAEKLGGYVPLRWGIVVENKTGQAFTAFSAKYKGVGAQTL